MQQRQIESGWLRKQPRFGAWNKRFFVLQPEDSCIRVFSEESSAALQCRKPPNTSIGHQHSYRRRNTSVASPVQRKPTLVDEEENGDVSPSHIIHLPKDLLVSEPFERMVVISPATRAKERAYVFKVWQTGKMDRIECIMTCGAATREDAMRWKLAIEELCHRQSNSTASTATVTPPPPTAAESRHVKQPSTSTHLSTRKLSLPKVFGDSGEKQWKVVENKDGVLIEGETEFSKDFPSLRARSTIGAKPREVFESIMSPQAWSDGVQHEVKVLREMSENSQIIYMQLKEIWIGPMKTGARDLVLLRYWRQDEEDGYVINFQSVEDAELGAAQRGFVRGKIFAMCVAIAPDTDGNSDVRIFCHADPGAPLNKMPSSVLQSWLLSFVSSLTGVKKTLEKSATVEDPGKEQLLDEESQQTEEAPAVAAAPAAAVTVVKLGRFRAEEWTETPQLTEPYTLRSKTYLDDKIKYKCHESMFQVVAADLYKLEQPTPHCAARSDSPIREIKRLFPGENRPIFVVQFMLPGPPYYSLCIYAVAKPGVLDDTETPFARLWNDYVDGTDEFRSAVFKMIPRVPQGPYIAKKTVGEIPALIAKKMKMNFYVNRDYVEMDADLGSSAIAGSILSLVKGYSSAVVVDLGFLFEAQTMATLPEVIIAGFRVVRPNMSKCEMLGPDPDPEQTRRNLEAYERYKAGGGEEQEE